jgi:hypothetical protein
MSSGNDQNEQDTGEMTCRHEVTSPSTLIEAAEGGYRKLAHVKGAEAWASARRAREGVSPNDRRKAAVKWLWLE